VTYAPEKTVKGSGSIPASFGGGEANVHLSEVVAGLAVGWHL
jgi:long-chain fatty acid transport protein